MYAKALLLMQKELLKQNMFWKLMQSGQESTEEIKLSYNSSKFTYSEIADHIFEDKKMKEDLVKQAKTKSIKIFEWSVY